MKQYSVLGVVVLALSFQKEASLIYSSAIFKVYLISSHADLITNLNSHGCQSGWNLILNEIIGNS